jgi:hypothetical protein
LHIFYKVKNKKMVERILRDVEEYVDILQKESIESLGDNN